MSASLFWHTLAVANFIQSHNTMVHSIMKNNDVNFTHNKLLWSPPGYIHNDKYKIAIGSQSVYSKHEYYSHVLHIQFPTVFITCDTFLQVSFYPFMPSPWPSLGSFQPSSHASVVR